MARKMNETPMVNRCIRISKSLNDELTLNGIKRISNACEIAMWDLIPKAAAEQENISQREQILTLLEDFHEKSGGRIIIRRFITEDETEPIINLIHAELSPDIPVSLIEETVTVRYRSEAYA